MEVMVLAKELQNLTEVIRQFTQQKLMNKPRLKLEKRMNLVFKAQQKTVLKLLAKYEDMFEEALSVAQLESIYMIAEGQTGAVAEEAIKQAIKDGVINGAKALISEFNFALNFDVVDRQAVEYLAEYGSRKVSQINATTRKYINAIVRDASKEGWSYNRTAKAIGERYEQMWIGKPQQHIASRAHFIAVTETGNAYMEGQLMTGNIISDQGLPMEKYWSTMRDDNVSQGCGTNEGAGWIDVKKKFPSGHTRPLRFPGCRCDLLQRVVKKRELTTEPPPQTGLEYQANQENFNSARDEAWEQAGRRSSDVNLDPDEYMNQALENFQTYVDDGEIAIRADFDVAHDIVKDGRFKTQYETNTSNGALDQNYRAYAEEKGLGFPIETNARDRPIYGYVSNPDSLSYGVTQYGSMEFVLKSEVKERTTVTVGDSLGNFGGGDQVGVPANSVNVAGLDAEVDTMFIGDWSPMGGLYYMEAQIQGGVSIANDVEHIVWHTEAFGLRDEWVQEQVAWFKDKGVEVIIDDENN